MYSSETHMNGAAKRVGITLKRFDRKVNVNPKSPKYEPRYIANKAWWRAV
jgi:hypothetical protein